MQVRHVTQDAGETSAMATNGALHLDEPAPQFASAREATLWIAERLPQPFVARDITNGYATIGYPHKGHTAHSSLYSLKLSGELRSEPDTDPMEYYVVRLEGQSNGDDGEDIIENEVADDEKDPKPAFEVRELVQEAPLPQAVDKGSTYLLTEAIEQLIVKIAEIQVAKPQIVLQVDLGDAARVTIAELERQITVLRRSVTDLEEANSDLRETNEDLATRLTKINALAI